MNSLKIGQVLKSIIVIMFISFINVFSQIIININQPPPNQLKVENLWSIDLTNLIGKALNIYLKGVVSESSDGIIFEVTSNSFQLPLGSKRVTYSDLSPITIHYSNKKYEDALINTGGVPEGEYDYTVFVINSTDNQELARGNIPVKHQVYNPLPPQLLSPVGGSIVSEDLPLFTWLPPINLPQNKIGQYEFKIVEIYSGQTFNDALLSNPAYFEWKGTNNVIKYPISARKLNAGVIYAWQVKVYGVSGELMGISEPSHFVKITNNEKEEAITGKISNILIPIRLIEPINGQVVEEDLPTFFAVVLMPDIPFDDRLPSDYPEKKEIIIVEIIGNQLPDEAIKLNPVWCLIKSNDFIVRYPSNANKLIDGNKYAWQMKIFSSDGTVIGISDVGYFEFHSKNDNKLNKSNPTQTYEINFFEINNTKAENNLIYTNTFNKRDFNSSSLNWILPFNNNGKELPIKFLGNSTFLYKFSDRQALNSEIPKTQWRWDLNSTLSIFDIPIGFNAFISSDQKENRQNINNFQLYLNPYELAISKAKGFLSGFVSLFSVLGIGTNFPNYSQNTLRGLPVSGIDLEFTPGPLFLAFTYGKTQKAIDDASLSTPTYRRDIVATKIGLGKKNETHFHITVLHSWDDESSITNNTSSVTPQENYLAAIESRIDLFQGILSLSGEVVGSLLTRDKRSAKLSTDKIPEWIKKIVEPRISSSVDYAYSVSSVLNLLSQTKLTGYYKMIGPGFISHGRQFMRNDVIEYELKAEQNILGRLVNIGLFYKNNYDNIIPWKRFRTTVKSMGFNLSIYPREFPYLIINYSPIYQENDSKIISEKFDNKNQNISFITGYNFSIGNLTLSTNFNFSFAESKTNSVYSNYKSNNYYLNEILIFKIPLTMSLSFGYSKNEYYLTESELFNLGVSGNYAFESGWRNSAGISYVENKNIEKSVGYFIDSEYPITNFLTASLRLEKKYFYDKLISNNDFDELVGYFNLRLIW